jgi:prepilin-type N-terminal cleavage/methylation domain-containing protein
LERRSRNIDDARAAGFTLVESLIASVVLAVAVVGIAGTLAASYQQQRNQVAAAESTQFARQLMEEISGKPFEVPDGQTNNSGCSGGNNNRATYDDISDYDGYSDLSTSVKTLSGDTQSIGTAGPYTRSVTVVTGPAPVGHTAPASDFKTVTITVTRPNAPPIVIAKVFTRMKLSN